jgi:hypothetical protein
MCQYSGAQKDYREGAKTRRKTEKRESDDPQIAQISADLNSNLRKSAQSADLLFLYFFLSSSRLRAFAVILSSLSRPRR